MSDLRTVTRLGHVSPFPEIDDGDDNFDEGGNGRGKRYHVRLLPIVWVWVRYEARRRRISPAEWVRRAVAEYDAEAGADETYKGKVLHVRVGVDEWNHVQKLARVADKSPSEIVRRAINQGLTATGMAESMAKSLSTEKK